MDSAPVAFDKPVTASITYTPAGSWSRKPCLPRVEASWQEHTLPFEQEICEADVVIGAVLVPGAVTPRLVSREMLGLMKPRSGDQ
jgi:hypothetical protein